MTDSPFMIRLKSLIDDLADGNKSKFAEMLGVSPVHIDNWTNRGSVPNAFYLAIMHKKTGVNLHWLLNNEGEKYLEPDIGEVRETAAPYGLFADITDEERDYIKSLLKILRTKQDKTVIAIKQNIDAFLDTPNKSKVKKTSNG